MCMHDTLLMYMEILLLRYFEIDETSCDFYHSLISNCGSTSFVSGILPIQLTCDVVLFSALVLFYDTLN